MGVEIQNEFVYPLEDFFTVYLSDYFNDSLFVIQEEHPLSELHCTIYFHDFGNVGIDFHNRGNRSLYHLTHIKIWYNYLYSDSKRSVIFTSNAIAIISS